VLTIPNVLS
jgi:hypothetical protein